MDTGVCTTSCVVMVGVLIRRKFIVFTRNWACSCATNHQNGALKPSCERIELQPLIPTMFGQWTLCTTSWQPVAKSVFLQSLIRSPASRLSSTHASTKKGRVSSPNWMRFAPKLDIPRRYALTTEASSSVRTWTFGPI